MKKYLLSIAMLNVSMLSFAQQYYSPNPRDLEPLARFNLENLDSSENRLVYTLPEELTGKKITVELNEVELTDKGRTYKGELGTAQCMGAIKDQVCVVVHKDLFASQDEALKAQTAAKKFISSQYLDPQLQKNAKTISENFLLPFTDPLKADINQPLGVVSAKILPNNPIKGMFKTFYVVNGTAVASTMDMNGTCNYSVWEGNFQKNYENVICYKDKNGNVIGHLTEVKKRNNHLSAKWTAWNGSTGKRDFGWLDFTFNDQRKEFVGYFGTYDSNMKASGRLGVWNGNQ